MVGAAAAVKPHLGLILVDEQSIQSDDGETGCVTRYECWGCGTKWRHQLCEPHPGWQEWK